MNAPRTLLASAHAQNALRNDVEPLREFVRHSQRAAKLFVERVGTLQRVFECQANPLALEGQPSESVVLLLRPPSAHLKILHLLFRRRKLGTSATAFHLLRAPYSSAIASSCFEPRSQRRAACSESAGLKSRTCFAVTPYHTG